jgi:hypothetical protein
VPSRIHQHRQELPTGVRAWSAPRWLWTLLFFLTCAYPPASRAQSSPTSAAPVITVSTGGALCAAGLSITFEVAASGADLSYQWSFNGQPIAGATSPYYTIASVQLANSGAYSAIVTNPWGSVATPPAFLDVTEPSGNLSLSPTQSLDRYTVSPGSTTVLTASASGGSAASPLTYQWYYSATPLSDGNGITGSQTANLTLTGSATRAGTYVCLFANSGGSLTNLPTTLTVDATNDIGRLINGSCRAPVGSGNNVLIFGFVIGGSSTAGSEPILARVSGPALTASFGLTGTLPDPTLTLCNGSTVLGANQGWAGNALITAAANAAGAFPWTNPSSPDSALLTNLGLGNYTVVAAGQSGDTGMALAEVYDATPMGTYTPAMPRLVNISDRAQVGTGSSILIAGFVIGGSTSRTVLIRASGPALANPFGLAGTLSDPLLQLFDGSEQLASNSGWGGNAQISSTAASVGAFPWNNPSSKDSAIFITLPPGAYTAQVSGAAGDGGVALVEVYEVP